MKWLRRVVRLMASFRWVRMLRYRGSHRGIVRIDALTNFEEACRANLAVVASNSGKDGLWYLGRLGGVAHHFACIDRRQLRRKLTSIDDAIVCVNGRHSFWRWRLYMLLLCKWRTGQIEVYRIYVTPSAMPVFGRREAAHIHVPSEDAEGLHLDSGHGVARDLNREGEQTETVEVEGFRLLTPRCFANHIRHDHLSRRQIDLVYTWVDGQDPVWRARKERHLDQTDVTALNPTAVSSSRFKQMNELRYSLRSALMYTNFVRRIFIVTDRQIPDWLAPSDRVRIIDHTEIFPDPNVLPTFNSHAIESCLHLIPGLSDQFLYLNDDILFARSVTLHSFFTPTMHPRINYSNYAFISDGESSADDLPVDSAAKNARAFFLRDMDRYITRKFKHVPCPVSVEDVQELVAKLEGEINETRAKRFRTHRDFSLLTCTYYHWMALRERSGDGRLRYGYLDINRILELVRLQMNIMRPPEDRWDVFCVNDVDGEGSQMAKNYARRIFENAYPLRFAEEK